MTPETPDEWLDHLGKRLDARQKELLRLHQYATGNAPLPEGATKVEEAYRKWSRLARTNFPTLIVDAVADRMTISGFRVGDDSSDNDAARALWRRSLGDAMARDVHSDMLTYGIGYVMASKGRSGAVLTHESPFATITDHDPLEPSWVRAGLKIWTDQGTDHAVLHLPGVVHEYERSHHDRGDRPLSASSPAAWEQVKNSPSGLDRVPIVAFRNRDGVGEFARHTDLLDRINWVILQRLLIIAMQAFRQRALRKTNDEAEIDDTDPVTGEQIDVDALFTPGPDALWDLPYGVEIWESSPGDIGQILLAVKDDLRDLCAVTRTPMSVLAPDAANQSAEGAALAREGLVFKTDDRITRAGPSWDVAQALGLALDDQPAAEVVTQWLPAARQSLAEKADAAQKLAAGNGGTPLMSRRRIVTDILGYGADIADQMEAELASETLTTALTAALTGTGTAQPAVEPPATPGGPAGDG